ncbi:MAG TPA: RNA polymerase sigma factor, partial [Anaerolineae bacterium]|nr:RNA polymerase sigma factor [Anaerolineae bacterium]
RYGLDNQVNTSGPEFQPLAEDFTQEALLKILANLDAFRGKSKFTTWAHKIAVRVALTELRRKRWKDRSYEDMTSDDTPYTFAPTSNDATPDQLAEQSDLVKKVLRVIDEELTPKQRMAMHLIPIGGLPIDVAADKMGMKRNALYKLMHDARLRLKKRLLEEGLSPETILGSF